MPAPRVNDDVNPQAYLDDLVGQVSTYPKSRIDERLPWNWRPTAA